MDDCGSRIKQLEQLLSEYQNRLQLDKDSDFSEVHSFGPYNFHQEHNKFRALLNGIHSRCKQCKSWSNSKHAIKAFVDRQQQVKHLMPIKTYIAECLDKIQGVIRENNLTDTIHRLELITRQVGLKFDVSTTYTECFISSDMFYVEVQLENSGNISEVKVQHYGEMVPVTCPALTAILRRRDYAEFLKHMQGLANLYQLTGDAFQKGKIFQALVSLEKDLEKIACSDSEKLFEESVLSGPVGFLTPRQGGQLMHITYFATPLELRGENVSKINKNFDFHSFVLSKFGRSLSISVEQSKPRLLPTSSLLSGDFSPDRRGNLFLPINETNSEELPASFVLHLDRPLVVSAAILEKIHSTLENFKGEKFVQNSKAHLDSLIIKKWLKERNMEYSAQMAYRQKLPEEEHIYRISEKDILGNLSLNGSVGVVISRIPFTHCQNVLKIISFLRQQLVYNQILTSALSSQTLSDNGMEDYDGRCFDVSTSNPFVIVITFEEPITSCLASVEFQVKSDCTIGVKFNPRKTTFYDCGYVSRVMQKCLSIPVTMKYIFKKARNMQANNQVPMVVDVDDTDSTYTPTPDLHPQQMPPQSTAYNLLATMIASSDTTSILPNSNPGMTLPIMSPSPTLPNIISTPSPSRPNFPFVFQPSPEMQTEPFRADSISVPKEMEQQPQPVPIKPPPIKLKFKKVDRNYIIETPKDNKREPSPVIENAPAATQFAVPFDTGGLTTEGSGVLSSIPFQQGSTVEQLISAVPDDQPMDLLPPESVSFPDVDNTAFLPTPGGTSVAGPSRVTDVDGVFQTLPGGATSSPGGLGVEDTYGFDTGLDTAFDIDAEIEAVGAGSVTTDSTGFDIGNVYDPGVSTSSTSAMTGAFDIDPAFDLETILGSGSQAGDGSGLDWGLGNAGGSDG